MYILSACLLCLCLFIVLLTSVLCFLVQFLLTPVFLGSSFLPLFWITETVVDPNHSSLFIPLCKRVYSICRLVRLSLLQLLSIELLHLKDFGLSSTLKLQGYVEWMSVFGMFKSKSENYKAHYKCLSNKAKVPHACIRA